MTGEIRPRNKKECKNYSYRLGIYFGLERILIEVCDSNQESK